MTIFRGYQKGVNLGGWISQFKKYDTNHFDTFITEKDLEYIAGLGFDHVRVPVDYVLLEEEDGREKEDPYHYLDLCLSWCKKYGLHMLIDLHECYGYSFDPLKKDMDKEKFFYDEAMQERFFSLWKKMAEHFAPYTDMVALEPLNEVVSPNVVDAWNQILGKYIALIRSISKDYYIVVGGVCYNNVLSVPLLDVPMDDHIVFNFHCYEPLVFTHQGAYWVDGMDLDFRIPYPMDIEVYREKSKVLTQALGGAIFDKRIKKLGDEFFEAIFQPAIDYATKKGAALYCGEYGVIDKADNEYKILWLEDIHRVMNRYGIGRSLWNYKEMDFGLVDESFKSVKEKFIAIL